uniref:Uncharacterized protein n=1 Tax=Picea glauca TaxID=3330 RepID=A0A124GMT5_PICGL|nr:hypothetical protein ABT39_MTgene1352 [Picea glauca]QHR89494.1 hypothetical protein Q903MT_gene3515 [Picea sitchensis]
MLPGIKRSFSRSRSFSTMFKQVSPQYLDFPGKGSSRLLFSGADFAYVNSTKWNKDSNLQLSLLYMQHHFVKSSHLCNLIPTFVILW